MGGPSRGRPRGALNRTAIASFCRSRELQMDDGSVAMVMEGQKSSWRGSGVPGAAHVEIEGVGLRVEKRGGRWLETMAVGDDTAAVARPQGEEPRGWKDDVGALLWQADIGG